VVEFERQAAMYCPGFWSQSRGAAMSAEQGHVRHESAESSNRCAPAA
jgi:hypothetical protein